jgi:uncharacterized membrane protein
MRYSASEKYEIIRLVEASSRSLPPAIRFPVTANEKTLAQTIYANG